jgi:hypothetical protein
MTEKFLKPFIDRPGILNAKPGDPEGYVTKDGMWAAVPFGKKFVIIHNGQQVNLANNYKAARTYISKEIKASKKVTSTLEQFL